MLWIKRENLDQKKGRMGHIAIIVLAAGKGTRMQSSLPKVLHRAAGRSLLAHVLHAARVLEPSQVVVVVGPHMEQVGMEASGVFPDARTVIQAERLGTAHAVSVARAALDDFRGTVVVLYGDVPLLAADTLKLMVEQASQRPVVLGFDATNPDGYGRLIQDQAGKVIKICEELDATSDERALRLCNSGVIALPAQLLWQLLPRVGNANAKREYYLTDIVALAASAGHPFSLAKGSEQEVAGVNDRLQLASIESHLQADYRRKHMLAGVTLLAPDTVYFSADTEIGSDVTIAPHVVFGPGVKVSSGVQIMSFCHIEGARIDEGARIGPFARLRPGADIAVDAHVGNFVEIKNANIGAGAKANHLSYIGDASVGPRSNIGAGTITCNYDGFEKHRTEIGSDVFVGSNTALIAPARLGDGSSVAAGTIVTQEVPPDALAISRPSMEIRLGWAARFRKMKISRKAGKMKG
jgi:bifunctional UDP-N-acetylglucosamine pyrophosphorylase/glucosamine-1-phosphate N-acetyltransferase